MKKRKRKMNAWDVAFGQRLSVARKAANLTQQEIANRLGVPLNTYQKYEYGKRSFPKDLIVPVIRHTHHGPWFLLTGEPDHRCPVHEGFDTGSYTRPETPDPIDS